MHCLQLRAFYLGPASRLLSEFLHLEAGQKEESVVGSGTAVPSDCHGKVWGTLSSAGVEQGAHVLRAVLWQTDCLWG